MSIQRPRRIFQSSKRRRAGAGVPVSRGITISIVGALGGGALVLLGLSGTLFGQNTPGATAIQARAADIAVIDGQTLRLVDTVVRLSGVVVPARGQACAAGPDCGARATVMLASLVRDQDVQCTVTGHDGQGRPIAQCSAGNQDLGDGMVSAGWAVASDTALQSAEQVARSRHRGQWLNN